jgi:membrane protease YdiL (CAAX protease family)
LTRPISVARVYGPAIVVIIPLIAAAWLPYEFPLFLRQVLLFVWGVGAIVVAERLLFSGTLIEASRALGLRRARTSTVIVALLVSMPMWLFLPILAWAQGVGVGLRSDWFNLLVGVVLVNGVTEEAIHRGFAFGHLRQGRSFAAAATLSAIVFAAQHLYIIPTSGWTVGVASVLLAVLLTYPMAFMFERGGRSIVGPAVLHTSANAPVSVFELPQDFLPTALVPHMVVVLVSLYLVFLHRWDRATEITENLATENTEYTDRYS